MELQARKNFQQPQLVGESNHDWPNASLDTLGTNLIAKLPYVLMDSKNNEKKQSYFRGKGTITVFKELVISPVPSANPSRQNKTNLRPDDKKGKFKILKLPKVNEKKKSHLESNLNDASYIEIVDDHGHPREILPPKKEITSPYHIATPVKNLIPLHEYLDRSLKATENELDIVSSHYKHPDATKPFSFGKGSHGKSASSWRDSQKQVFLWESQYVPKRIHDNFVHDQLEKYFGKKLTDFDKKQKKYLNLRFSRPEYEAKTYYNYPDRYLPTEGQNLRKAHPAHNGSPNILEFLLELSDLKYAEKKTLSRLQTAVDKMEEKEERYKRKVKSESRENDFAFIRKLYELEV